MKMPDITPAQITAIVGWAIAQAVAYGWLTSTQSQVVMSAGATIVAAALKIADAFLRGQRNQARAAIEVAQMNTSALGAPTSTYVPPTNP